jgi:hypothetical protein
MHSPQLTKDTHMSRRLARPALHAFISALVGSALASPLQAAPSWNASVGAEADESSASAADVTLGWSPTERFGISFSAGHVQGADDLGADFDSTTIFAGFDWRIARLVGVALAYDTWDDSDAYEKRTTHASLYVGHERARFALLAQSVESETTADLLLLRRQVSIGFDGKGYGAELTLNGERVSGYASYLTYDYDESTDRLLTFLANPDLARRPRLDALAGSGLTAAAALLDRSATIGADFYVRRTRLGVSYSSVRDIVTESDSQSLRAEVEWPVATHWSVRLVGGMNDSDIESSALFGGARILFDSN